MLGSNGDCKHWTLWTVVAVVSLNGNDGVSGRYCAGGIVNSAGVGSGGQ